MQRFSSNASDLARQWQRYQDALKDEMAFAASMALNDAAFAVAEDLAEHVDKRSDLGATKFTKRAFHVAKRATKRDLETDVVAKDKQAKYLIPALYKQERVAGDYATTRRGVIVPGREWTNDQKRLKSHGNFGNQTLKKTGRRKGVFWGRVYAQNEWQYGLWQRKALKRGRRKKGEWKVTVLSAIALFRERVVYNNPLTLDLPGVAQRTRDRVVRASMETAMLELRRFGKVRTGSQRKKAFKHG